ncbi:hypothetical protein PENTCL1PPCAC_17806, partial [Pristionchus entomophagus]
SMPPKRRGMGKVNGGRKRKGKEKKEEGETPSKKRLTNDDGMKTMEEDIEPMIEMDYDDRPSTSGDTEKRRENETHSKICDDEPSSSKDIARRGIPQFVVNIIEKKAKEKASAVEDTSSPSGILHDEGDKRAATMRELTTLLRILSRGRYEEITEGEAQAAIANTGTEERRNVEEETESSESEDEWEEMELADPEGEGETSNKNIEVR